jgi:urease subunit gamma/beta
MVPGEMFIKDGEIELNGGRKTVSLSVSNTGDRPIQVGSHYHFFEANRSLAFDRGAAYGLRLNIPSGTAVRFEPGDEKEIELTEFGGRRVIHGGNGLVGCELNAPGARESALDRARTGGFQFGSEGKK